MRMKKPARLLLAVLILLTACSRGPGQEPGPGEPQGGNADPGKDRTTLVLAAPESLELPRWRAWRCCAPPSRRLR